MAAYEDQLMLEQLCQLNPEVEAAAYLEDDGTILGFAPKESAVEDLVAPLMLTLVNVADRATQELGRGVVDTVMVEASQGLLLAKDVSEGRMVAVLASKKAPLGLVLADLNICVDSLLGRKRDRAA